MFVGLFLCQSGLHLGFDRRLTPILGRWAWLASGSCREIECGAPMGKRGAGLEVLDHAPKHGLDTCGGLEEARIVDRLHGRNGIDRGDLRLVGRNLLHEVIAGQLRPDLVLKLKRLVIKRGVAGADHAQRTVDVSAAAVGHPRNNSGGLRA